MGYPAPLTFRRHIALHHPGKIWALATSNRLHDSVVFHRAPSTTKLAQSLGKVGDAFDTAAVEPFWGRMQTEFLDTKRSLTRVELSAAIFDWDRSFLQPGTAPQQPGDDVPSRLREATFGHNHRRLIPTSRVLLLGGQIMWTS
jgi:hypothetical protein